MDGDDWCSLAVRPDARSEMKVRKAVITAAGRGTRQYPASSTVQKEMFPLVDVDGLTKPTVQIIAEEALDAGIEELCIVSAPGDAEMYRRHFRGLSAGPHSAPFGPTMTSCSRAR